MYHARYLNENLPSQTRRLAKCVEKERKLCVLWVAVDQIVEVSSLSHTRPILFEVIKQLMAAWNHGRDVKLKGEDPI